MVETFLKILKTNRLRWLMDRGICDLSFRRGGSEILLGGLL